MQCEIQKKALNVAYFECENIAHNFNAWIIIVEWDAVTQASVAGENCEELDLSAWS